MSSSSQAGFFLDPATHENVLAEEEMETQVRSGQSSVLAAGSRSSTAAAETADNVENASNPRAFRNLQGGAATGACLSTPLVQAKTFKQQTEESSARRRAQRIALHVKK